MIFCQGNALNSMRNFPWGSARIRKAIRQNALLLILQQKIAGCFRGILRLLSPTIE